MRHFGPKAAATATALALCLLLGVSSCRRDSPDRFPAVGIVEEVKPEFGQVVIDHEEIVGLMEAMTMNFAVPDPELLDRLEPGQKIEFEVRFTGKSYDVVSARVVGQVEIGDGWARLGNTLVRADPAPNFTLIDQAGQALSLADLAGQALLIDFIYTLCPGPCPILTATHISALGLLEPSVREGVRFVSITLDPAHDTPEILSAHAKARGMDLAHWSLLTGPPDQVHAVVRSFGAGGTRNEDGEIDHLVVSFLIDSQGQIVKRYVGQKHTPEEIAADVTALVGS